MVAPLLWAIQHPVAMVAQAFPQTFPVVEFLTLIPSGCLFTASSCPLTGSALQTLHSSTQPPLCTSKHVSQAEARQLRHFPPG